MKRLLILPVLLALLMPSTASAAEKVTYAEARSAMSWALNEAFYDAWSAGGHGTIKCLQRINRVRIRCTELSTGQGDVTYRGRGQVWDSNDERLSVRARVKQIDEYCLYVRKRPRRFCVKTFEVKTLW